MQPEKEKEQEQRGQVTQDRGGSFTRANLPTQKPGRHSAEDMDHDENIERRRQDVLMKLFGQFGIHDVLGDPEPRDDEKKHEDREDPAAGTINRKEQFLHEHRPFVSGAGCGLEPILILILKSHCKPRFVGRGVLVFI